MQGFYKYIIISIVILVVAIALFIPFYPVVVVPEWEIIFVTKDGSPTSSIRFEQMWKDYSLEFGSSGQNSERNLQSDSNGYIKLPARQIRVSVFQIIGSRIRDVMVSINPHSSSGPGSAVICWGKVNCLARYEDKKESPQRVMIW